MDTHPRPAFRIVALKHGRPASIKHGVNGDRTIPTDTWHEADVRWTHDPGDRMQPHYWSGWHTFDDISVAEMYRERFKCPWEYVVVMCYVVNTWPKPTSNSVNLSQWIYIAERDFQRAMARDFAHARGATWM